MLTAILLLTAMPLVMLIIGFFEIRLPFVSEHPEMHLMTLIKEQIANLLHIGHKHTESVNPFTA